MNRFSTLIFSLLCCSNGLQAQANSPAAGRVDSLITVSRTQTGEGEFEAALETSAQAADLALRVFGEESASYGSACFNEGRVRYFMNKSLEAIPWYERSRTIRAKVLGADHVDYGKSLNNLAIAYEAVGRYKAAEPLYQEVLRIREKIAGRESASYANALANLSGLYLEIGQYEAAEATGLEAKAIRARVVGKEHPSYAASLNNLGNLYLKISNFAAALRHYEESVAILKITGDTVSYDWVLSLNNLGMAYYQLDEFGKAAACFIKAQLLIEDWWGRDDELYADSEYYLGLIHESKGELERAKVRYALACMIMENIGYEHTLPNLNYQLKYGRLLFEQGDYDASFVVREKNLGVAKKILGEHHLLYASIITEMAVSLGQRGAYKEAASYLKVASKLERGNLKRSTNHLPEEELFQLARSAFYTVNEVNSLVGYKADLASLAYNNTLFYKGFIQDVGIKLKKLTAADTSSVTVLSRLTNKQRELGRLYATPNPNVEEITSLEIAVNDLEKTLIRHTEGLEEVLKEVDWQEVRVALLPGEAAIEFIEYGPPEASRYGALLLTATSERPDFVPLITDKALTELLTGSGKTPEKEVNELYNWGGHGRKLYESTWLPLEHILNGKGDISTIYLSLHYKLHRLNLQALPIGANERLGDHYDLVYVGSTRQIATRKNERPAIDEKPSALLYGGIDYGFASEAIVDNGLRGAYLTEEGWKDLPWTEIEVTVAADLLQEGGYDTRLVTGQEATERGLKEVKNPTVLHIASHGFYFDKPENKERTNNGLPFVSSKNPLIRSGLVLAGANASWLNPGKLADEAEDGILTAFEARSLALENTELVVLSACDTGLGELRGDEGVYGLQRAFRTAGAHYLIVSLWQVPDYQAQAFSLAFYEALLQEGQSIPQAFRSAQQTIRAQYPDPFYWAGFVLTE